MIALRRCLLVAIVASTLGAGVARAQSPAPLEPVPATVRPVARAAEPAPLVELPPTNAIYLELFGPGLFYTVNYEHRFGRIAARAGFGYFPLHGGALYSAPVSLTYLAGSASPYSAFEIGVGAAVVRLSNRSDVFGLNQGFAIPMLILGGRRQSRDGHFVLRGGFSPVIGNIFLPIPYLAAGLTF